MSEILTLARPIDYGNMFCINDYGFMFGFRVYKKLGAKKRKKIKIETMPKSNVMITENDQINLE